MMPIAIWHHRSSPIRIFFIKESKRISSCYPPHPPLPLKGGGLACLPVGRDGGDLI